MRLEAFEAYVAKKRDGTLTIERLPARDDSILRRVQKIRDRDYLYIDSMQDYYDEFSQRMHLPYQDFRRASFDSVVKARQLKKKGNKHTYCWGWCCVSGYLRALAGNHSHD